MTAPSRRLAAFLIAAVSLVAGRPASADLQVEVLATAQSVFNATGNTEVSLTALARTAGGDLFAFDALSRTIIKITAAGVVSPFVSEDAILDATGASTVNVKGLAIGAGGDLFAADQGGLSHSAGVLRIPTSGATAGTVSVFVTGDAIAAATGPANVVLLTGLASTPGGDLFLSSAASVRPPATEFSGIARIAPNGSISLFVPAAAVTAVTGKARANLSALSATASGLLLAYDGGSAGSRGLLQIPTTGGSSGAVSFCVTEAAIKAATSATGVAITALSASGDDVFAADTGSPSSNALLKVPTTGGSACTVGVLTPAATILAATGGLDVNVRAAAGGLLVYDDASRRLLSIATSTGAVTTLVATAGFFPGTLSTSDVSALAAGGSQVFATDQASGAILGVPTTGASKGVAAVAIAPAAFAAATGDSSSTPGALAMNLAVSPSLFVADQSTGGIVKVTGGAASLFATGDAIGAVVDEPFVTIDALALGTAGLFALDNTGNFDIETTGAGIVKIDPSTAAVKLHCGTDPILKAVAKALGVPNDEASAGLVGAAINSLGDLFTFDFVNGLLLRVKTASCKVDVLSGAAALAAAAGVDFPEIEAIAVDAADILYAFEAASGALLAIPTAGASVGVPGIAATPATLLAATGRNTVDLAALAGGGVNEVFAADAASDSILRIFANAPPPPPTECQEPTANQDIECKLNKLVSLIQAASLSPSIAGNLLNALDLTLDHFHKALQACADGKPKNAATEFSTARNRFKAFINTATDGTRTGRNPAALGQDLANRANDLDAEMANLETAGVCTGDSCLARPDFDAIGCILGALHDAVGGATIPDAVKKSLLKSLDTAQVKIVKAKTFCPAKEKNAASQLKSARSTLKTFTSHVASALKKGQTDAATAASFTAQAATISGLLDGLIAAGACSSQ